jgi:hypothetical protein
VEDIGSAVAAVTKNGKQLREAAALFALNPSIAFCRMQKAKTKV